MVIKPSFFSPFVLGTSLELVEMALKKEAEIMRTENYVLVGLPRKKAKVLKPLKRVGRNTTHK